MAKFYAENNKAGAKILFAKRGIYKHYSGGGDPALPPAKTKRNEEKYPHLVNFNFGEKYLYGRVNRLFVPMEIDNTPIIDKVTGITSTNANHMHKYQIDKDGNGWALEASHPDERRIRHRHKITKGMVEVAESSCYPDCEDLYGVAGAPPHSHNLLSKRSKTITTTKIKKFNPKFTKRETGEGALNFVVDAFSDLAQQFEKAVFLGKIDTRDEFLSTLKVHKAYQSPKGLYDSYRMTYFDVIAQMFKKNKIKARDYDEFLKNLMQMLSVSAKTNPITKVAYMKSRACPVNCSGLVIEIANLDFSNDYEKIVKFYNSNNWEFYVQACASYGFMIDRNAPWRLVADIGSSPIRSAMMDYAEKYNLNSTSDIIENSYKEVHLEYYENFKKNLLQLYNKTKVRSYYVPTEDGTDYVRRTLTDAASYTGDPRPFGTFVPPIAQKVIVPPTYSQATFFAKYSEEHFLKTYFEIRFIEEESQFADNEKDLMIDDCIELYRANGLANCLNSFERILNKPFDYNGSLSYIRRRLRAVSGEELQSETDYQSGGTSFRGGGSQGY
jgi:hypothetical protein